MNYLRDLIHRLRLDQSDRAIARDMHLSRVTIRKYREMAQAQGYLDLSTPLPDLQTLTAALGPAPKPPRPSSSVLPFQEVVEKLLDQRVEMTAILDRLRDDYGYTGTYSSLRRFVHRLRPPDPEACVRLHSLPGEEAQVDFGSAGLLLDPLSGHRRQTYVFVMTLCFSRHQYAELVFDQKIPTWLDLHRRAFESFGGVPQKVVLDNLKAAVPKASLHDPILGEAYRRFAQHYGFIVSPTRPSTPQHKGKVESGIHYVKRNFLAGQSFIDIRQANHKLGEWVRERAGTRQHGTTHQPPLALFAAEEKDKLLPLPTEPFELTEVRVVKVHSDCHVTIDGSYYSVSFKFVGQQLEAYLFQRVVQLFCGTTLLATHPRASAKGEWHTRREDYSPQKAAFLEKTPGCCQQLASQIGPATKQVVEELLLEKPLERLRSVQAILRLEESVGSQRLENACERALFFGDGRYRRIKDILNAGLDHIPLPEPPPLASASLTFTFQRSVAEFFGREEIRC